MYASYVEEQNLNSGNIALSSLPLTSPLYLTELRGSGSQSWVLPISICISSFLLLCLESLRLQRSCRERGAQYWLQRGANIIIKLYFIIYYKIASAVIPPGAASCAFYYRFQHNMFRKPTEALFIIARIWKQPRCPSADEWIRKLWYVYTMEYYSAIKKNTFESVLMRWMKLEPIIQSEVSQKDKHQYSILTHIYGV